MFLKIRVPWLFLRKHYNLNETIFFTILSFSELPACRQAGELITPNSIPPIEIGWKAVI
jgi:hypothetical protein